MNFGEHIVTYCLMTMVGLGAFLGGFWGFELGNYALLAALFIMATFQVIRFFNPRPTLPDDSQD